MLGARNWPCWEYLHQAIVNATHQGCFILGELVVKHLPDTEVTSWLLIVMVAIEVEGMGDQGT